MNIPGLDKEADKIPPATTSATNPTRTPLVLTNPTKKNN